MDSGVSTQLPLIGAAAGGGIWGVSKLNIPECHQRAQYQPDSGAVSNYHPVSWSPLKRVQRFISELDLVREPQHELIMCNTCGNRRW
jgi:hypothetical protein